MRMSRRMGLWRKISGVTWKKYAVISFSGYEEVTGSSETQTLAGGYEQVTQSNQSVNRTSSFRVGSTYSFNSSTGQFTVNQTTNIARSSTGANNAVGKYYITLTSTSGSQTGTTVYKIVSATYSSSTLRLTVQPITSQLKSYYMGGAYSFDTTTGEFTVAQTTAIAVSSAGATSAVGKYFVQSSTSSGTLTGSTLYRVTAATYSSSSGLTLTVEPTTSQYVSYETKGSYIGDVSSDDPTEYPIDGIQNGYWYVMEFDYSFTYSGDYVESIAQLDGSYYRLLEITGSGTLTFDKSVLMDVWFCGGGGAGGRGITAGNNPGGGGAYPAWGYSKNIQNMVVTIGAGGVYSSTASDESSRGGTSSVSGSLNGSANGGYGGYYGSNSGKGGSGGGAGGYGDPGTGNGYEKKPFDSNFFYPLCDGGGGGGHYYKSSRGYRGGAGGTNGSNGSEDVNVGSSNESSCSGGAGGGQFGGAGGHAKPSSGNDGSAATGYGSGGGAGGYHYDGSTTSIGHGGSGYQGVCYVRIPI